MLGDEMTIRVIVPNELRDAIYAKVDAAISENPNAKDGRECFYEQLLSAYADLGYIPEFALEKKT